MSEFNESHRFTLRRMFFAAKKKENRKKRKKETSLSSIATPTQSSPNRRRIS